MKAKLERHHNQLSIDLITSRTNCNSKSISNFFPLSPSNNSSNSNNYHQNFSNLSIFSSYSYDKINLSAKKTNIIKLKREHFKSKLRCKEAVKSHFDNFHLTVIKEKLKRNYSSLFLTKTTDITMPMPLLSPILHSTKIDIPKTGLCNYKVYPIETAKAFTQRCCDIARVAYLAREQKAELMKLEEEETNKIDSQIQFKRDCIDNFNEGYSEYKDAINKYLRYLGKVADKESDALEELRKGKANKLWEKNKMRELIEKKKEISTSMNLIKTILTCAKEAILVLSDKGKNINKRNNMSSSSNDANHTSSPQKELFQEFFPNQHTTDNSNSNENLECNSGFFLKALTRLRINKSLNEYFTLKYRQNPFVFESSEDLFEHVSIYENQIINLINDYDKKKSQNNELNNQLQEITIFVNSNVSFEQKIVGEKEKEREAVIEKYQFLIKKREKILQQKTIQIKRKQLKVATNPSYLTSNQSDAIIVHFKYNSLSKQFPIPFACVYAKLLEIIKNIECQDPCFVCFDNTTAFCSFDIEDLHELYKKRFNSKNEDEVTEKLLVLLKIIERSFKEIMLSLRKMKENKSSMGMMIKLLENIDKEKKIIGMTHQRGTVETIRKLIMRNVDEKAHRFSLRQKRKVNIHSNYWRDNKKKKNQLIDKKKFAEAQFGLNDLLDDIKKDYNT